MTLPLLRDGAGKVEQLAWTRLRPAEEVQSEVAVPPEPRWQPGLVLGPSRKEVRGSGFDRREVVLKPILAEDPNWSLKKRASSGDDNLIVIETDPMWDLDDLGVAEVRAREILAAHDFPVELAWPEPRAWIWDDGSLWWVELPAGDCVLVDEEGGVVDLGLSFISRGGLGSLDITSRQDLRAARRWPRFSNFGWALAIHDFQQCVREARSQARAAVAGAPGDSSDSGRNAQAPDVGGAPRPSAEDAIGDSFARGFDGVSQLAFALGGYLAEYRIRRLHSGILERGERNLRHTGEGALKTARTLRARRSRNKKHALESARTLLSGKPPRGHRTWSLELLAVEIAASWKAAAKKPAPSTIRGFLKDAKAAADPLLLDLN